MTARPRPPMNAGARLMVCLVSRLARVSARKRASNRPETNAETTTRRLPAGRWQP
jgi:hypothetical protein